MDIQTLYQQTLKYAAGKHVEMNNQLVPGTNLPYVVHLSNVAMEILIASQHTANFNTELAVQAALLHDVVEDTKTTLQDLRSIYGEDVTNAVSALTKNGKRPKEDRMADSLRRIKSQPKEVWAVKLADRITNLQKPPIHWDTQRMINYRAEAQTILDALGEGNAYLAARLKTKIEEYETYLESENPADLNLIKKVLYIDMDNVLVDFPSGIAKLDEPTRAKYKDNYDDTPGIFSMMDPLPDAISSFNLLAEKYDTYILSTAPWKNPSAWSDKVLWVQKHLGEKAYKRLIISHHKNLNKGHFLIDDREKNGAKEFEGELIQFGSEPFKDWHEILKYMI